MAEWSGFSSFLISSDTNELSCPIHPISLSKDDEAISAGINWVSYRERISRVRLSVTPIFNLIRYLQHFFFVARWEEVFLSDSTRLDQHGRFKGSKSQSFLNGVLDILS